MPESFKPPTCGAREVALLGAVGSGEPAAVRCGEVGVGLLLSGGLRGDSFWFPEGCALCARHAVRALREGVAVFPLAVLAS